jgi:acid phosphatase type 7
LSGLENKNVKKYQRKTRFQATKSLKIKHLIAVTLCFLFIEYACPQGADKPNDIFKKNESFKKHFADSLRAIAYAKKEGDYTVPSFTLLRKAIAAASSTSGTSEIMNLRDALINLQQKTIPYSIVININGDPSTRMAFNWFTNAGIEGGTVEIVPGIATNESDFAKPLMSINARINPINDLNYNVSANRLAKLADIQVNTKKSYISHKAIATGLTPSTTYSFRVGNEGGWSNIGSFRTANKKGQFSFLYTTDPQANNDEMFNISQMTTHSALNMFPDVNFWLHCGDLVQTKGRNNSEWEWEQFFLTQQDIFLKIPFAPVPGNHDVSVNRNFTFHFNTDSIAFDCALSKTSGGVYSFVYGNALFFALSFEDYKVPDYLNSVAKWMRKEMNEHQDIKWRIAFYHKPLYTGSKRHQHDADGKTVRNRMAPLFDSLKIDLALQGHDHIYEVIGPVKNKQLIHGAVSNQIKVPVNSRENVTGVQTGVFNVNQGTLFFLNNSSGKKKYEPRSKRQMDKNEAKLGINNYFGLFTGRFGQNGRPTFSNLIVTNDTITVATYGISDDGSAKLFDKFKVTK